MKSEKEKPVVKEPSASYGGKYSYADYLTWQIDGMVEIINGRLFKMASAPSRIHQKVAIKLAYLRQIFSFPAFYLRRYGKFKCDSRFQLGFRGFF